MTPIDLHDLGAALYAAPGWQTALARDLGVAPRTVRRWLAGERQIPDDLARRIAAVATARIAAARAVFRAAGAS